MFQWITVLETLGYILIFPGFLFCFLVGLFLSGVDRKIVARMQKRVGPPLLQPFYDFFKLCGKETIVPAAANKGVFLAAPLVGLASLIVLQLFIPVFNFTAFSTMADVIVILYLLLIPALAMIVGGAASGSPYAGVGLSREMVTVIACELPLVLVLLAIAKAVGNATGAGMVLSVSEIVNYQLANGSLITHVSMIPAAIAFLLIIPGETGSHPFDTAEAETEICEPVRGAVPRRHRRRHPEPRRLLRARRGGRGHDRRPPRCARAGAAVPGDHHRVHLAGARHHRQTQGRAGLQVLLDRRHGPRAAEPRAGLVRILKEGERKCSKS